MNKSSAPNGRNHARQDINLLTLPSGSGARHPAAREVAIALIAVIAIGAAFGFWYDHRDRALTRATRDLNADIDDLVMNLEERSHFLAERNADPELVAELKDREQEADDKSRVLDLLSGESVGNTDGFSAHLSALGRRHPEGLWLEHIRIGDGGRQILLRGFALDADLVPRFLAGLGQEPVLAGMPFATFALAADGHGGSPLQFALATVCEAGDDACIALAARDPADHDRAEIEQ